MSATAGTMLTLQQALALLQPHSPTARLVGKGATPLARVHTDTRTLQAGDLFVALKGERFDANAFLADARAGGLLRPSPMAAWPQRACRASRCPTAWPPWGRWPPAGARSSTCR